MAREPCHSATADGDEVFPRRGRERMTGEPPHSAWRWSHSHGDTAGVQRMVREPCHGETAGGERPIPVLTSDRACSGAAKHRASV